MNPTDWSITNFYTGWTNIRFFLQIISQNNMKLCQFGYNNLFTNSLQYNNDLWFYCSCDRKLKKKYTVLTVDVWYEKQLHLPLRIEWQHLVKNQKQKKPLKCIVKTNYFIRLQLNINDRFNQRTTIPQYTMFSPLPFVKKMKVTSHLIFF